MIKRWEIHLATRNSIGGILLALRSKGIESDFKLIKDGDYHAKLIVKNPSTGAIHHFGFRLYSEIDGIYTYEVCAWTEPEYNYLMEIEKFM